MGQAMERQLVDSLRPSAAELRTEAWKLLEAWSRTSDQRMRRSLAQRAFELAQLAGKLEDEASERTAAVPAPEESAG
jgi:hypothetical protein